MKASPAGRALVCPSIFFFATLGLPRTDGLNVSNAVSGTNEKIFHLKNLSDDFTCLGYVASVSAMGGFYKPGISPAGYVRRKDYQQVDIGGRLSYPGMVSKNKVFKSLKN